MNIRIITTALVLSLFVAVVPAMAKSEGEKGGERDQFSRVSRLRGHAIARQRRCQSAAQLRDRVTSEFRRPLIRLRHLLHSPKGEGFSRQEPEVQNRDVRRVAPPEAAICDATRVVAEGEAISAAGRAGWNTITLRSAFSKSRDPTSVALSTPIPVVM